MKVWFLADLHFGCRADNEIWLKDYSDYFYNVFIPLLKEKYEDGDIVCSLGDIFDNRNTVGINTINVVIDIFEKISDICTDIRLIVGNHDTDVRLRLYDELGFTWSFGARMRYGKYHFFLSHYPTLTANPGEDKLTLAHINLYGHIHSSYFWISDNPFAFQVGCDANRCEPIEITTIIKELKENIPMVQHKLI